MPVVFSRWAHIGCAVAVPEVFFEDVNLREGINISQITPARRKLVSSAVSVLLRFCHRNHVALFCLYTEVFLLSIKFIGQWE